MISRYLRLLSVCGAVVVAAACSKSSTQLSPAGPSAVLPDANDATGVSSGGWTASSRASAAGPGFDVRDARSASNFSGVGHVGNLRGSCQPAPGAEYLSFNVQGVQVVTNAATEYFIDATTDIAGGCGNLRNGTKVHVVVSDTQNTDRSYTALKVTILDQPGGKPPTAVEGEGVVGALKGTCPSVTMVIHGHPVMTTSSTTYGSGGSCEALKPGTRVHVSGVLGGNSVVADVVTILAAAEEDADEEDEDEEDAEKDDETEAGEDEEGGKGKDNGKK